MAISSRSFSAWSRWFWTICSGALEVNASLESLASMPFRWPSALAFSLAIRASSCSTSTSSANGMKIRAAWVMTSTMPFWRISSLEPTPETPVTSTSLAEARRWKKGIPAVKTSG